MKIIYKNNEGNLSVVNPVDKSGVKNVTVMPINPNWPDDIKAQAKISNDAGKYILNILKERPITEDEWLAYIGMKDVPQGISFEIVEDTEIPSDRIFRDAWEKDNKTVKVEMSKARVIYMGVIREERNKELDRSDKEILKKLGKGNEIFTLETERQRLRDIPQTFDLEKYTTSEALKAAWPDGLPREL